MKRIAVAIVMAAFATSPALAGDDPFLAKLAGDWIGRGVYRQAPDADNEPVYCKITNTLADDGASLSQKGRCALASNSAALEVTITAAAAGRYTGSGGGLGIASRGQATLTGTGTATAITLNADLIDTHTQKTGQATVTMEIVPEGFLIRTRGKDETTGKMFVNSEVVFSHN